MAKKRVHEVAKELNIESREIINKLSGLGINVKSHMSALEDSTVERLRQLYGTSVIPAEKPGRATTPAAPRTPKEINNQAATTAGVKKARKANGQQGEQRRGGRSPETNYYHGPGPGLVDRVPSRPPDRRFEEKPASGQKIPAKMGGRAKYDQGARDGARDVKTEKPKEIETQGKFRQQLQDGTRPPKPLPESGYPEQPPHGKQTQNRPAQSKSPVQRYEREQTGPARPVSQRQPGGPRPGTAGSAPGTGPQRGGERNARPGGQPGARAKFPERSGQVGAGPDARIKADLTTAAKPLGRLDEPERIHPIKSRVPDKAKAPDKPKQQAGRQMNKGRYDKRNAAPDAVGDNLRPRTAGGGPRKKGAAKKQERRQVVPVQPVEKKPVVISGAITVQELALKMHKTPAELIKKLMQLGVMATINQEVDTDTASLLAVELGYEVEIKLPVDLEALLMQEPEDDPEQLTPRPCIVTVMGHVDHGKTSLLDAIRQTDVTSTEAGGITQHIGAYQVEHGGKKITFVDTPGHEAFTAMRARGAQVTDIAILVVAAEDGVMPQTVEAINHAKEAGVPVIVAINKIDKPTANPERVKQELTEHGLIAEEWGGDTICVNVSALKREGLPELLEMILLVAEMKELKANPARPARGTVIEAELDKGRGPVATVLVQNGTLQIGDNIIAGAAFGRVRAMIDDKGRRVKKAGPSTPVEVLGFSEAPMAGDIFVVTQDEKLARSIVSRRQAKKREEELGGTARVSLDDLYKRIQEGKIKELSMIVKADVQGSVEALRQALERLNTGEVKVNIIHGGVGAITETDIMLASASNAIILGFNVRPDVNARKAAENEQVDVRLYRVIYEAIEDVRAAMNGLLDPEYKEVALGRAEIRKIFKASKIGTIAGCYVVEGKMERDAGVRLVRDGIVIHEGKLNSLKRFKDDVKEVGQGYECGLAFEKFNEIQEGDIVEAFTMEAVKRELA